MLCYPYCDFSGSGCVLPQQAPSSINGFVLGYVIDDNVQCYGHAWGYVHPVSRREGGAFSVVDPILRRGSAWQASPWELISPVHYDVWSWILFVSEDGWQRTRGSEKMRFWLSVLCEYGDHFGSHGAGGPGESLPASLRAGGSYKRPLTASFF